MLHRIDELLQSSRTFAFETTLATKSYKNRIIRAQKESYKVTLLFFWLDSIDLAIERVKSRVSEGGHSIPIDVIARRYEKGIQNLFEIYLSLVDELMIFDNSEGKPQLIAEKIKSSEMHILNTERLKKMGGVFL